MRHFDKVAYHQASVDLKPLYDDILHQLNLKKLPNWASYLGGDPATLKLVWQTYEYMYKRSTLPILLKELIMFAVSRAQVSPYCTEYHASNILKLNQHLSYDDLEAVIEQDCSGWLPEGYHTAVAIAVKHSQSRCNMLPEDFSALAATGFSPKEVIEIITICSLAMFSSTLTMGGNIPVDDDHKIPGFALANSSREQSEQSE